MGKPKITVIGDVMLDTYTWGRINRLNPEEEGAPLVDFGWEKDIEHRLGGAANVAANIARLDTAAELIGLLGDDRAAEKFQNLCDKQNVYLHGVTSNDPTIEKRRIMSKKRQILRIDNDRNLTALTTKQREEILHCLSESSIDYLVFSDYAKYMADGELVKAVKEFAQNKNIPILADLKPKNFLKFKDIYLIKPNFGEFCDAVKQLCEGADGEIAKDDNKMIEKYGKQLVEKLNVNMVVTRSEYGATLITKEGYVEHIPTKAKAVNDVSGAGDTFMAALTVWLSEGMSLPEAVKFGNKASGIAVGKVGTAVVSREEMNNTEE